jgi:hypothetical protein
MKLARIHPLALISVFDLFELKPTFVVALFISSGVMIQVLSKGCIAFDERKSISD